MNIKTSLSHRNPEPENSVLYVVGTPIGNLDDISIRAIKILQNVSLIACEDTRQTRKLMSRFQISNKLVSFNKYNSFKKTPMILNNLKGGNSIALVSDAGMPSICDPGEDIIKASKLEGFDVICIPGPCAAITALVSSGMPSSSFVFIGFLPKKKKDREKILFEISENEKTTILFESPYRLKNLLIELLKYCGEKREIEVKRELTKKYEEHIGNNLGEVISFFEKKEVIGEITIVIKGIIKLENTGIKKGDLKIDLNDLINAGLSLSAASKYLAKKNNLRKSEIYNLN